jgi:hypothetical protein
VKLTQERALRVGERELGEVAHGGLTETGLDLAKSCAEFFEDVVDGFDEPGSVADELVTAAARETVGGAGEGKYLAVLLHYVSRGRERSAARSGLDHDDAERDTRNDPVALATPLCLINGKGWRSSSELRCSRGADRYNAIRNLSPLLNLCAQLRRGEV